MPKDFNITSGGQYDMTRNSLHEVNASDVDDNAKSKLLKIFSKFDITGDGKLNSFELAQALDYFSSFDNENCDGNLTNEEFNSGAIRLTQDLGLSEKDKIKVGDIKKFIKKLMKLSENTESVSIQELFFFMDENEEDSELDIQNLVDAEFDEDMPSGGHNCAYTLTYKNGTIVKVKADKTYDIITKDEANRTTVASYNADKQLLKQVITDANNNIETIDYTTEYDDATKSAVTIMTNRSMVYSNGDTENIEYKTYDEIGTVPVKMTQVTNHDGVPTTSVTSYMGGIRVSEVVTTADSEFTYSCSDLDSQLVKSVENKGTPNERTSLYTYNDNNTISVSIKEGNKSITQVRAIPIGGNARDVIGDERTITYENIINENGESIENIYLTEGHGNARIETITSLEGKVTRSIYNENGKKENSVVEYNAQQYAAEYDGKGNTYMVYTIDDPARMAKLARAFGTTPEAIFALNKDLVHTNPENGAKYFVAGTKIRIPGEISADNRYLQARGSQEYEVARGNQLWGDITEMVNAEA